LTVENMDVAGVASADEVQERLRELADDDPYRLMAESVESVAFFLLGLDGTVMSWNPGAERIEGYAAEDVLGRHFSLFYTADAVERGVPEYELAVARDVGRCEVEGSRVRRDGSRMVANVSIAALRGRDGGLIGYSNVTRDMTEARGAQERLREANARMSALMDSTADGILEVDHDWLMLYGNRKAVETLPDFKVGRSLWACFPALVDTSVEQTLRRAMEERVPATWENHYAPYDLWYRSRAFPTEDGVSIFYTDITAEKTMQNQLALEQILREKRIEALSHMAGGLAHEINNPLAIIHARASDLKASVADDMPVAAEEVLAACGSIVHTADRAIRVLRALQGFAREAGADPMQTASIYDLLDQCVDLLEARFHRHSVELKVEMEPGIAALHCRETQIRQIISNLLNNALDAINEAGIEPRVGEQPRWVVLRAHSGRRLLHVDVMDSGPGIEEKFRAHLMDPFFTTKVRGLGMGVGLSLSKTIAQEHGGTLTLLDDTDATCFRLTLPLAEEGS
jgi:PAS domain S-box-containing protein